MSSEDQQAPEGSPVFDDLVERLGADEEETRGEAVMAVGQLSPEMAMEGAGVLIPPLVEALRRRRSFAGEVFTAGLESISVMGSAAVPHLVCLLDADNYYTIQVASAAVARTEDLESGERGRTLLAEFINPEPSMIADEWKARYAVQAVAAIGDDRAVDFLASQVLGSHPNEAVRMEAAWALGRLGNPRAAWALRQALNDPSTSNVQPTARQALARLEELEPGSSQAATPSADPSPSSASTEVEQKRKPWWKFW